MRKYLATFKYPNPPIAYGDKSLENAYGNWMRNGKDQVIYEMMKKVFANLLLSCRAANIHFVGASEMGNLWKDYGTRNQEKLGDKPKVLAVWMQYVDCSIKLERSAEEINKAKPPKGAILPAQPKMRIQGLNPTWTMDWFGFVAELEAAAKRRDEQIPEDAQVKVVNVTEEGADETAPVTEQQPAEAAATN